MLPAGGTSARRDRLAVWIRPSTVPQRRSPVQRLRGRVVRRKETLESKLREGHVDRRAEHRRRAEEAQFSGVGDKLEGNEHARGFVAGNELFMRKDIE